MNRRGLVCAVALGVAWCSFGVHAGDVSRPSDVDQSKTPPPVLAQPRQEPACVRGDLQVRGAGDADWATGACPAGVIPLTGEQACEVDGVSLLPGLIWIEKQGSSGLYAATLVSGPNKIVVADMVPGPKAAIDEGHPLWLQGQATWPGTDLTFSVYIYFYDMAAKRYRIEFFANGKCQNHRPDWPGGLTDGSCKEVGKVRFLQSPVGDGKPGVKTADGCDYSY
jgi:hypothetical protein